MTKQGLRIALTVPAVRAHTIFQSSGSINGAGNNSPLIFIVVNRKTLFNLFALQVVVPADYWHSHESFGTLLCKHRKWREMPQRVCRTDA